MQIDASTAGSFLAEFLAAPVLENPFPWYAALQKAPPVYVCSHNVWLVSGYDACRVVLSDAGGFGDWDGAELFQKRVRTSEPVVANEGLLPRDTGNAPPPATISPQHNDGAHTHRQMIFY
jgi:cytochrome P450